ncbi:hypothetical protein ACB092_02G180400 [Castanea dentata]
MTCMFVRVILLSVVDINTSTVQIDPDSKLLARSEPIHSEIKLAASWLQDPSIYGDW